jgi:hypothetical protein
MRTYKRGDYNEAGCREWMWVLVTDCDDEKWRCVMTDEQIIVLAFYTRPFSLF